MSFPYMLSAFSGNVFHLEGLVLVLDLVFDLFH